MKFECTNCKKSGQVDDSKVPESGVYATCPQCNNRFLVKLEVPKDFEFEPVKPEVQESPRPSTMTSPHYNNSENTKPKTSRSIKPLKKIIPQICSIGAYGSALCFISLYFFAKADNMVGMVVFGLIGLIGVCTAGVYGLVSLGRCWSIIQGTTARTTPGKAVGFLFIPFFSLYWTFIAYAGLATDANKYSESQCLKSRINYSLAVASCVIFLIPYLNFISFIFFTVLIYQMAAFHNEIIDKWDKLSELPDTSKSANGVVIAASATFAAIVIIGILAAIAIPQFSAYRERVFRKAAASAPAVYQAPTGFIDPYDPPAGAPASAVGTDIRAGLTEPNAPSPPQKTVPAVEAPRPTLDEIYTDKNGFIVGSDIVTDTRTGLMWVRNGNIAGNGMTWNDAMGWVNNLNYGGYDDWRIPSKKELVAFAKRGGSRPYGWFNANGFTSILSHNYWTSITSSTDKDYAWYVDLREGLVNDNIKGIDYYVWPVRGGR